MIVVQIIGRTYLVLMNIIFQSIQYQDKMIIFKNPYSTFEVMVEVIVKFIVKTHLDLKSAILFKYPEEMRISKKYEN